MGHVTNYQIKLHPLTPVTY